MRFFRVLTDVPGWILDTGLPEPLGPKNATVAVATGQPFRTQSVAGRRGTVVHTKGETPLDDLALRQFNERCMNAHFLAFNTCLGREVRQGLKGFDKGRTTVRVP